MSLEAEREMWEAIASQPAPAVPVRCAAHDRYDDCPDASTGAAMLERGMFVENVHPCNRGRYPIGLVESVDVIGLVSVRLGRGSACFGPAENWRQTSTKPEWLKEVSAVG